MRKDIDLSFMAHPMTGDLATKTDESAVRQSLRNIVLTNFYERGFNVDVGSNFTFQLFENVDDITKINLRNAITNSINNYEPDVDLKGVYIEEIEDGMLNVKIIFVVFNEREDQTLNIRMSKH